MPFEVAEPVPSDLMIESKPPPPVEGVVVFGGVVVVGGGVPGPQSLLVAEAIGAVSAMAAETAAMPAALKPTRRMFFIKRFPNLADKLLGGPLE